MITKRNYFSILILIGMIFIMFMFVGVSQGMVSSPSTHTNNNDVLSISRKDTITNDKLEFLSSVERIDSGKMKVAIITSVGDEDTRDVFIEWCTYLKYPYQVFSTLPEVEVINEFQLALFGEHIFYEKELNMIESYSMLELKMIFSKVPELEVENNNTYLPLFGIDHIIEEEFTTDGIKIFSGFMLNKERIYDVNDFYGVLDDTKVSSTYYKLTPGYEVYSVGLLDNQKELDIPNEELPPFLWRSKINHSFVYMINLSEFRGTNMLGVLTGFLANSQEQFIYPIVNAQTISMINYPYLSNENQAKMEASYSRSSEAVSRDILWPDIVHILINYGNSFSFFGASQLDYSDAMGAKNEYLEFYLKEIRKVSGSFGISLGQVSKEDFDKVLSENQNYYETYLPNYRFQALYLEETTKDKVEKIKNYQFLEDVTLVMSNHKKEDRLIDYITEDVLSIGFNQDGRYHETRDDISLLSIESALGMSNMMLDIGHVIYPSKEEDYWNELSLTWSKGKTYQEDFKVFDNINIYDMEKRTRRFLALDYKYEQKDNDIILQIDNFMEEAYFIYRSNKSELMDIEGGSVKKINDSTYLIKANKATVKLKVKETHKIHETIPYQVPAKPTK